VAERWRGGYRFTDKLTELDPAHPSWTWPMDWPGGEQPLLGAGQPSLIFVGMMTDTFHADRPTSIIDQVISPLILSRHIGLLLTKRPERMAEYFAAMPDGLLVRCLSRLWCGFSAERQKEFDARWPHMRELAELGLTAFVSVGPMLAPARLPDDFRAYGNRVWVICSGEQGPYARYMDPAWARALLAQCREAGVPFFMLQMSDPGRKKIPGDLLIREFPRLNPS
jgi:protein gp37